MVRSGRSKSSLFLIEQLIVIAVFAVCAAVCVFIMTASYQMSANAVDTRYALLMAENTAEGHKAFGGDLDAVAALLGGRVMPGGNFVMYFNKEWAVVPAADSVFSLQMVQTAGANGVLLADIQVTRLRDDNVLIQLQTAVRGGAVG
jgi:hypothetical protein